MNIPTTQAQQQGLHGSDCYRHIMYLDDLHRRHAAVMLNLEAIKAFADTIIIKCRHDLISDMVSARDSLARGGLAAGLMPKISAGTFSYMNNINYEHLKIACGFELHLKARLVNSSYIVHKICDDKSYGSLAKMQKSRPVAFSELLAIDRFRFNGSTNYLPGINDESIKFSWITMKPDYRKALQLTDDIINIIDYYRQMRNQIHLPNEYSPVPNVEIKPNVVEFIINFVNTEVIKFSNDICTMHNMDFGIKELIS